MPQIKVFRPVAILASCLIFSAFPTLADEGMWTFDNPPVKQLQEKYHFTPTKEWLDHVRLSSVRLNDGGSGSFVSPLGLLLTNHHVALGQLQKNSTADHDYVKNGFYAATEDQEIKCPDLEVNVLDSMENVTPRVLAALKGAGTPEKEFAARKAVIAGIERESLQKTGLRSDVVTLYQGGEYWLYRYKKYTDLRIVFAPEQQIAFYGGDPDNFTYPRYDLDMALFRVYENGKPIDSKDYLKWNPHGAADNELVFVSGNPGRTERLDTMAELQYERDIRGPLVLKLLKDRVAVLQKYAAQGPEQAREAASYIFMLQNSIKAYEGREQGLQDSKVMAKKQREEQEFRAKVAANPELQNQYGGAWDAIVRATEAAASRAKLQAYRTTDSQLSDIAARIVDYVAEIKKPDGERLPGYHDAELDSLRFRLFSKAPIYRRLEIARMTGALQAGATALGPDEPFFKRILNGGDPRQVASELIQATKLADPAFRKQLIDGGQAAVDASTDPLIVLQRDLDPIRRAMIKWREDNVESVEQQAGEKLGRARFAVYGKTAYPDATFTLRPPMDK